MTSHPAETFGAGSTIAGKYRLIERLGSGGMGAVWRASHLTLGSDVAVKVVHPRVLESDQAVRRFLREARAAATLRSPHVVQILDHGIEREVPYLVMELLEGETLGARLARRKRLGLDETATILAQVARAVARAHAAGVVHRDLKPDNVFLVRDDDREIAKVLDFGIAKVQPLAAEVDAVSTSTGALLGTPGYMSPEQVRGHSVDARSDLWALGVIAYECATGRLPFQARTVGEMLVEICTGPIPRPSSLGAATPEFDAWIDRALCRRVEGRFQSARELADALGDVAAGEWRPAPLSAAAPPARRSAPARPRRSGPALAADTLADEEPSEATFDTAPGEVAERRARWPLAAAAVLAAAVITATLALQGAPPSVRDDATAAVVEPSLPEPAPLAAADLPPPAPSPAAASAPTLDDAPAARSPGDARPPTTAPPARPAQTAPAPIRPPVSAERPVEAPPAPLPPDRLAF